MNTGKIIGIVSLVFVVTFTGLLATKAWNPSWNPFRPSPKEVIKKTGENITDIETFDSKIIGSVKGPEQEIGFTIDYKYDGKGEKNKMKGNGTIEFATEGMTMTGETEFITIEDQIYLKVKTFPSVLSPYLQMLGLNSNSIKEKWVRLSTTTQEKESKDEQPIEEFEEEIQKKFDQIFVVKEQFSDEKVNGEGCYHYLVELDNQKAKELTKDIMKKINPNAQVNETELNQTFNDMEGLAGEVWIGKSDYKIYKLKTESKTKNANNKITDLALEINFSNYNRGVDISAPEDYSTLQKLMQENSSLYQQQLENLEGLEGTQKPKEIQVPTQQYQY